MRSKGNEVAAKRSWPLIGAAIWLLASLSVVSSCGDNTFQEDLDEDYFTSVEFLSKGSRKSGKTNQPLCTIVGKTKKGVQEELDMESYIAKVVACENKVEDIEALKAQAVAARSWIRNFYRERGAGAVVHASESHQVHECGARGKVTDKIRQAVAATAGEVVALANADEAIAGLYVAGSTTHDANCVGTRKGGTEIWITYNEGKTGRAVKPAQRKFANPDNRFNRGTLSQNGSVCLAKKGYDYKRILRFYYGQDARIVKTPTCSGQGQDVGIDQSTMPEPTAPSPVEANTKCGAVNNDGMPAIHSRTEWGAAPASAMDDMGEVKKITVSHSAGVRPESSAGVPAALRGIQQQHIKSNGWSDIGFHFAIDGQGGIWELRSEGKMGAHSANDNANNIGIVVLGNYSGQKVNNEEINLEMTKDQRQALTKLVSYIGKKNGLDIKYNQTLFANKRIANTTIVKHLDEIAKAANAGVACEEPEVPAGPEIEPTRTTGYYKVRLTALDGKYPVDTVSFNDGKTTHYASSSTGGSQGTGEPDAKDCDSWESKVVVLNQNDSKIWTFDQPFLPSDKVEVVQRSVPKSASCPFTEYANSKVKVEIAGKDGNFHTVSDGAHTFNASQLTQANGSPLPTFNDGGLVGGISGALSGLLGLPIFELPGIIKDYVTNLIGVVNSVVGAVKSIDFKNIFNNISIGKDFKFEFDVSEKAASLEFYVNGELVKLAYNKGDGFSVDADVIKIFGLNEVVAVIKDAQGKVIGSTKAVVNKVKEAFGMVSPLKDILYGKKVNLQALISNPEVQKVAYYYGGKLLCEGLKSKNFSCEKALEGLSEVAKKIEVVAKAMNSNGEVIETSTFDFLASTKGSGVAMVTPKPGEVVNQKTVLTADANDPEITHVEYHIDGKKVGESANRKSGFAYPVDIKTQDPKAVEIEVKAFKGSAEAGSQKINVQVAGNGGVIDPEKKVENPDHVIGTGDATALEELKKRLASEAAKAWIAGSTCAGAGQAWYSRSTPNTSRKGDIRSRNHPGYGHPRCSAAEWSKCAGSQGLCYKAVKGAMNRAKVAGVEGTCPTKKTQTVHDKIYQLGGFTGEAYQFYTAYVKNPTAFKNKLGFDLVKGLNSTYDAEPGDIIVWGSNCRRTKNDGKTVRPFSKHGHIEIVAKKKTVCSDYCSQVNTPYDNSCWHVFRAFSTLDN